MSGIEFSDMLRTECAGLTFALIETPVRFLFSSSSTASGLAAEFSVDAVRGGVGGSGLSVFIADDKRPHRPTLGRGRRLKG